MNSGQYIRFALNDMSRIHRKSYPLQSSTDNNIFLNDELMKLFMRIHFDNIKRTEKNNKI